MNEETLYDLRCYVSNCFNHRGYKSDGITWDESGYQQLSRLMTTEYDLDNNDVDEVVSEIEDMLSKFIMENSPKFTDND
jgi:acetolactate synthase small subunit